MFPRSEHWRKLLTSLIAELRPQAPEHILAVLDNLEKASAHELELMADALLNREFGKVGSERHRSSGPRCRSIGRRWPA